MPTVEKSPLLTSVLILFAVATFVYRYWDVFFKSYGERGKVYFGWTLYLLGLVHSLIGILALVEYLLWRPSYNWLIGAIAFALFVAGQGLRNWAVSSLGPYHSPKIEIKPGHRLIQKPPYRYLRNPYYAGVILEVLATPLILNAYLAFAFSVVGYLPILFLRAAMEEKILRDYFGAAYVEYEKKTPRFVPRLRNRVEA